MSTTSAGYQYQRDLLTGVYAQGRILAAGTNSLAGLASRFEIDEDYTDNRTAGAFISQQVAFRDRVFLTAALRADDNSAFGTDFGTAYYPSLNASWVLNEEPFFPQVAAVGSLRLRAAYGRSGLRPNNRDALLFFEPQAARAGTVELSGVSIAGLGRRDLKPEIVSETELGFDAGLFGTRLNVEFTYFDKESRDALILRRLPASLGRTAAEFENSRFENLGSVQNRGVEWLLSSALLDRPNVRWNATVQGSTIHNKLLSFGDTSIAPIIFGAEASQQHRPGYSLGGYWGIPVDSAVDVNANNQIDLDEVFFGTEERFLGNSIPTRQGSVSSDVTLFGTVRLSALADYRGGYKLYNASEVFRCQVFICRGVNDPGESLAEQTRAVAAVNGIYSPYVEDASFVKLREVAVTLIAPTTLARRVRASALSFTVAGRNLGTWTDYTGLDPEVNSSGQRNFDASDFLSQPQVRYFTARLKVGF